MLDGKAVTPSTLAAVEKRFDPVRLEEPVDILVILIAT
jgi:hypothetical protein